MRLPSAVRRSRSWGPTWSSTASSSWPTLRWSRMPEAVWFRAPRQVEIGQEEAQEVGAGDIRVQALVSGLSAGSEMLVYRGQAPTDLPPDLPTVAGDFR